MIGHAPIAEAERADVLDALRAFALLGIFISHVPDFSGFSFMSAAERAAHDPFGMNATLGALSDFLIRGKFFSLFSLLFGIGFAVQLESATRRGANFARHFARRLTILFLIGLAHAFLWYGDILKDYALIGLVLILTARWTPRATGAATVVVLLARALWPLLVWVLVVQFTPTETGQNPGDRFATLAHAFAGADPVAMLAANVELLRLKTLQMIYDGKAVSVLAMFLLGAFVGKQRLYRNLTAQAGLLRRVFVVCLPVGVVGNALLVPLTAATPGFPPSPLWVAEQALFAIAVPAMTLAYACGFALLWSGRWGGMLRPLAPVGRMALTTYVSQTLIGIAVFCGIGLGWNGSFGLAECIVFAAAVFAMQCAISAAWLAVFRFGPLEWLWRRATYGTPLAMMRRTAVAA